MAKSECYRGIHRALDNNKTAVADFCRHALRGPAAPAPLPGLGSGCGADALADACRCAVPDRDVWAFPRYRRNRCYRSVDRAFDGKDGSIDAFRTRTRRELDDSPGADFAVMPSLTDDCADADQLDTACSCVVGNDFVWTASECVANRCYRHIDTASASSETFCSGIAPRRSRTWLLPRSHVSTRAARNQETFRRPATAPRLALVPAGRSPSARSTGAIARWTLQSQLYQGVSPPKTPAGLNGTCAAPGAMVDACRCVELDESALALAFPACAANECYRKIDDFFGNANRTRDHCRKTLRAKYKDPFPFTPQVKCGSDETESLSACACVLPNHSEWSFPACREDQCYRGIQRALEAETRDFCHNLVNGKPLEEHGLDDGQQSTLLSSCDGGERPGKNVLGLRRDISPDVRDKILLACRCVLSQPDELS